LAATLFVDGGFVEVVFGFISASLLQGFVYHSVIYLQYHNALLIHNTLKFKYL